MKIIEMSCKWAFPSGFLSLSLPPLFPAYSWEWSSVNYQASTEPERNHWGMSICSRMYCLFSPLFVQTAGNFFFATPVCHCLFIFFTSFTINASESHVGCFRYHTESSEFSKVRVTNTQCRKTSKQNMIPSVPSFAHTVKQMDCIFQFWIKYFILTTSPQPSSAWFKM